MLIVACEEGERDERLAQTAKVHLIAHTIF